MNKYSKFIVALVIILNVSFVLAIFKLLSMNVPEPNTLIIAWFGFTTGELWMLSTIKNNKTKAVYNKIKRDM